VEDTVAYEEHGCYLRAFFVELGAAGGHGAGEYTADFSVVASGCSVEDYVFTGVVEDRCYDGDIG
jgi:hypothetical protein